MKQRLVILSDLWGSEKSEWVGHYTEILQDHFEIAYYDSRDLGGVTEQTHTEEHLHHRFIEGGLTKAVQALLELERESITVLGFSIGGTIAWQACHSGLRVQGLFAVSSTRLRLETKKPATHIELFYGEKDTHSPSSQWFGEMGLRENIFDQEGHEFYKRKEIAGIVCHRMIQQLHQVQDGEH